MRLQEMEAALREIVAGLEPERLSADAAVGLVDTFVSMEKLVAAGKALAARRVAASNLWRGAGERSAAHWLARRSGVSIGNAMATLETAARLPELPGVDRAVRAGELSAVQANEIASAAGADPGAEAELLAVAQDDGFALRDTCRRVKAAAAPDGMACHRAIHASRSLRHWSDPDGAGRLDGRFTPEVLAELLVALEPFEAEAFRVARDEGRREGFDAYRADALLALARAARDGTGAGSSPPRNTVHVVIDHAALVRGKAEPGERCEVAGVGPVPVNVVRSMMDDAFVTAVVTNGVDVATVAHLGRRPTAHQRSALEVRDPECVVSSCHVRVGLEIDHVEPWSATRVTKLDALARLCRFHHAQKTHEGYRLEGGPGHWRWLKPDGTDVDPRPPPPTRPADDGTGTIAERQARICDAAIASIERVGW
ncbi:MAG: DUF222 domain-containing protein [Actinobacteria bacterium]|nr:MAG: DUF222 domain-containing protein [Actinomycetota bacterium]